MTIFGQNSPKSRKNIKIQFAIKIDLKAKNRFLARIWKAQGLLFRLPGSELILDPYLPFWLQKHPILPISDLGSDIPFWLQKGIKNERFHQMFLELERGHLELSKSGLGIAVRRLVRFLS